MKRYGVSVHIQSECGKMRTRNTPNINTFHAVRRGYINRVGGGNECKSFQIFLKKQIVAHGTIGLIISWSSNFFEEDFIALSSIVVS